MPEHSFDKFSYKTKAMILLNEENIDLKDIGLSWLLNEDKKQIVKTANLNKNKYTFSLKNNNHNIKEFIDKKNVTIFLGCIFENSLRKVEIKNISIKKAKEGIITQKLILNEDFTLSSISDFDVEEIIDHEEIKIDIDYWQIFENKTDRINSLANKTRLEGDIGKFETAEKFKKWYIEQPKKCCYCGIKEEHLIKYFNKKNEQYKDARQRGQYLEIERITTAPKDKNVYSPENCALVCYICNNAKSDFLSPYSFKPIAQGINKFWNDYLKEEISFPEESKIWERK